MLYDLFGPVIARSVEPPFSLGEARVLEEIFGGSGAQEIVIRTLQGRLSGLLIGRPGGRIPVEKFTEYDEAVLQVVREEEGLSELPVVTCMDFGHTDSMLVLPPGVEARIDCETQQVAIVEAATVWQTD